LFRILGIVICLAILLASCALGPEYSRPRSHGSEADGYLSSGASFDRLPDQSDFAHWWRTYDDQTLDGWVEQLAADNLDLKGAAERVIQAREQVSIQRGAWWPSLGISGDGRRSFAPGLIDSQERSYRTNTNVNGAISWQVDLFGRTRRAVESAEFTALARASDHQGLQQTLVAELVRQRAILALLNQEIDIQKGIVFSREQTLKTVSRRYQLGVKNASAVGVHAARENSTTALAQLALLQQQFKETLLSVEVLLNQRPGSLQLAESAFPLLPPGKVPDLGTPAMLLDRRPDIVGSEFRLMAANAGIGVAIADLFPDLTISASGGFSGDQFGGLLTNNNAVGAVAGQVTSRLFEGGRLRAQIRLRESQARELSWQYAQTVLTAMAEVERALVQERYLRRRVDNLQASAVAARHAEALSQKRYQRGITTLLEVLETQRRRQNAERNLLAAQRASWTARINLHLALGGDWVIERDKQG
jgi:outer membrane protein, multidrug efflux system